MVRTGLCTLSLMIGARAASSWVDGAQNDNVKNCIYFETNLEPFSFFKSIYNYIYHYYK